MISQKLYTLKYRLSHQIHTKLRIGNEFVRPRLPKSQHGISLLQEAIEKNKTDSALQSSSTIIKENNSNRSESFSSLTRKKFFCSCNNRKRKEI